jgi:dTDP-4-amino-4,6-dideoxygalactose transaminase
MIQLFHPQVYKEEWLEALADVFSTRWIGQGPLVDSFEEQFSRKFNYDYCLAVNSGSAALELAYHLIGIKEGDEVITTCFTCTATNIPLLRRNAKVVFADINDKLLIDYNDVCKKVSIRTKAIVVVTLGGLPIDERIFTLAKGLDIPVVIDAAQSLGISEKYGDYVCYSFQAIKHFTTGDGGMLVVRDVDQYVRAKKLRWFGIDREVKKRADWKCLVNHQMSMEIEEAGYKFHMNDIAAAMGIVGLSYSNGILAYRQRICSAYVKGLPDWITPVYGGSCWLFGILVGNRDEVMDKLRDNGVECDLIQLRNDIFKAFGGHRQDLPNMNDLEGKYLYLPLNSRIGEEEIEYITGLLRGDHAQQQ